jgi:hypothetical protein
MTSPKVRRIAALAAFGLAVSVGRVHAEPQSPDAEQPAPAAALAPPASPKEPLVHLAVEIGNDTPLGNFGIALELHPLPRLIIAGGLGWHPSRTWTAGSYDFQAAISSRFRLLSLGNASLAAGLGFSRGNRPIEHLSTPAEVVVERAGAIRLNPELSLDYRLGFRWTVRAFAGLGIILTDPSACYWFGPMNAYMQCAQSPPPGYQDTVPLVPYGGVGLAANIEKEHPGVGPTWYGWQIIISDVAAVTMLGKGSTSSTVGTERHLLAFGGLALWTFGGPTIHAVHQKTWTALLSVALRVVPPLLALAYAPSLGGEGGRDFRPLLGTMVGAALADWTVLSWSRAGESHQPGVASP